MEKKPAIVKIANLLPALSGAEVTYNAEQNVFLTKGYQSVLGNNYFQAIRVSKKLAVVYNIGVGYYYTFLNGITLYANDGTDKIIIGSKAWGGANNYRCFSESSAKDLSIGILKEYLESEAKLQGVILKDNEAKDLASKIIEEVHVSRNYSNIAA